jgi:hypothetical protein
MLRFEQFDGTIEEWDVILETFPDRTLFQTAAWLGFISETQHGRLILAQLRDGGNTVGVFAGLVVTKFGQRILGSPFKGWTTPYMGIRLREGITRRSAIEALFRFAFGELRCIHVEFLDRLVTCEDVAGMGCEFTDIHGFEIDLSPPEATVFGKMDSACRRCIRKAEKEGVVIEEARDEGFADEYYAQLQDVFAKQGLVPTYDKHRVQQLMRHLLPTGNLLLLRARDREGRCIATGIFPAMNTHMYFWGGASWRQFQIHRPNEAIQWYAMRYWKSRGIILYDMCGGGEYKAKYGGNRISVPFFRKSKHAWIALARKVAFKGFQLKQHVLGMMARRAFQPESTTEKEES